MKDIKTASFADMVKATIEHGTVDGVSGDVRIGGQFEIPLDRAAITASDIGGREVVEDGVDWLAGDADASPIMARLRIVPTTETSGKLASGSALPQSSMQAERMSAEYGRGIAFPTTPAPALGDQYRFLAAVTGLSALDEDGAALTEASTGDTFRFNGLSWQLQAAVFGEYQYDLDSVVEVKTEISMLLVTQSEFALDSLLEAHRLALSDRLLEQVLAGDGTGNNLAGVASTTGVSEATYQLADRGGDSAFTAGELNVEDGGGRVQYMGWAFGKDLSTSARTVAIEPGASRRVEERGRLTLSGTPTQRITEGLAGTTGIVADWATVIVPVLDRILVVTDRISNPGDLRITSRLACSDPIVSHKAALYRLTQA